MWGEAKKNFRVFYTRGILCLQCIVSIVDISKSQDLNNQDLELAIF